MASGASDKRRYRILNVEPEYFSAEARAVLESVCEVHEVRIPREELLKRLPHYDVLIVRLGYKIDAEILHAGENLKAVATATTGLDHIDARIAEERGIHVLSLQGEREFLRNIHATAEHTWALLLALTRKIAAAFESVKVGKWNRDEFRGSELHSKTLGVVGLGRIGEKVAQFGLAFGMSVVAHDPLRLKCPKGIELCKSIEEVLARAEIVSLHVPMNAGTKALVGRREVFLMQPNSILINTSRGGVIDESALLEALRAGHLGGVAIDVVCDEFEFPSPTAQALIDYAKGHSNLLITPHIGGATDESMAKTELFMAHKIRQFLLGI